MRGCAGLRGRASGKVSTCQWGRRLQRPGFDPWIQKFPWRTVWQPMPVFLPGESHGFRELGSIPGSRRPPGGQYGNPCQYSCLENLVASESWVQLPDPEYPLKDNMATHASIPAWRIPQTEEFGRLQSIGLQSRTRLKQVSTHTHGVVALVLEPCNLLNLGCIIKP